MEVKKTNEEKVDDADWCHNLFATNTESSSRVRLSYIPEGRVRNLLDDILLYLRGFKEGAIPCMIVTALMFGGLWYGLLGLVPAHIPHPYRMIIIWGAYGIMMFFAYGIAYTRKMQNR